MISNLELFIALRYLRSRRKEVFISIITVISVLGVALSVMVLNMVLSIMTGFERTLQTKLFDSNAHITIRAADDSLLRNYNELLENLPKDDKIKAFYPFTYNQALISTEYGSRGLIVRGVANQAESKARLEKILPRPQEVESLFNNAEVEIERPDGEVDLVKFPTIIIGKSLEEKMGLVPGSIVTLIAPQFSASPQGAVPRMRRFVVSSVYKSGLVEYESGLAYVGIESAQNFFSLGNGATGIEAEIFDLSKSALVADSIRDALYDYSRKVDAGVFTVSDWTDQNRPLWEALQLEKRVYFIVLLLLILIASFSIVSTLVMMVMEKGRDIAIFKTMGASKSTVSKIFLYQGTIIGFVGIVLGSALGLIGCLLLDKYGFKIDERVFSMSTVPVEIIPLNFVLVAVSAFVITSLAGIYPARRAASLNTAEALRFE